MSNLERQLETSQEPHSDPAVIEWSDLHKGVEIHLIGGLPITGSSEQQTEENLDPRHFYAAYVFDQAHQRQDDIATLVEQAQRLSYPVRFWWLSDAMQLHGHPDRLIVCAHHPSSAEDAGMDLYQALKERQVTWDDLEAAAVAEYCHFGDPIKDPEAIYKPDGTPLFPPMSE
jgi:hypothetical protein